MEKTAYLRGLMEGLGVHPESREGRLFFAVCEALDETAEYAKKLEARVAELEELCNLLDEGLGTIEELVDNGQIGCTACAPDTKIKYYYTEKTEDDTEAEPVEEQKLLVAESADDADEAEIVDTEEYETICPTCGKVIVLDDRMLEEGETICPNCGEELEFDFDEEEIESLSPDTEE